MANITPETTNYLIAGYAVFFSVFTLFIASLFVRWVNLKRDFQVFEDMEKEKKS